MFFFGMNKLADIFGSGLISRRFRKFRSSGQISEPILFVFADGRFFRGQFRGRCVGWPILGLAETKVGHLLLFSITFFSSTNPIVHLFLRTCVLPHTPTDGVARIFFLTPMPQPVIELASVQLRIFEGP